MIKHTLSILVMLLSLTAMGQDLDNPCGQSLSKKAKKYFLKAEEAFESGAYKEAKQLYLQAYKEEPTYAPTLYKLGNFAFNAADYSAAKRYYLLVEENCSNFSDDLDYKLGRIAYAEDQVFECVERLDKYLSSPDAKKGGRKVQNAKEEFNKMKPLYDLLKNPVPFNPKPLPTVNTADDEYLAVISPDGKNILYTKRYTKKTRNELVPRMVEEFTASVKVDGVFSEPQALGYPFNQSLNAGGPSITADNKQLYLTVCSEGAQGKRNCDIFYTYVEDGFWVDLAPLPEPINLEKEWESQPSVSADGQTLYFVSSREGGFGGLDIYKCVKENGSWSEPMNLGPEVNTKGDEKSPFIHSDSKTLYFASNGHKGVGGYDVFFVQDLDTGYSKPVNIGYPINSEEDDLGLFVSLDGATAYFASNKLGKGPGGWDLYAFELPEKVRPDEMRMVAGNIKVDQDAGLYGAQIDLRNLKTNQKQAVTVDSVTGEYFAMVNAKEGNEYLLTVNQEGYAFSGSYINLDQADEDGLVKEEMNLSTIDVGRAYELRNINFESNSAQLTPGARAVVEAFASFLMENPKLKVTIEGHTDNVGAAEANLKLSQERAEAVVYYLKSLGIEANRMKAKGFGESRPVAGNQTESGRAANRRTVFVVDAK